MLRRRPAPIAIHTDPRDAELLDLRAGRARDAILLAEAATLVTRLKAEIESMRDDDSDAQRYAQGEGPV